MAQPIPPTKGPGRGSHRDDSQPGGKESCLRRDGAAAHRRGGAGAGLVEHVPFAWQHGNRLFLLEAESRCWILAELRFDPAACHYVEVRRARYRWAREAGGSLLGRALAAGEAVAGGLAIDLAAWISRHRGVW